MGLNLENGPITLKALHHDITIARNENGIPIITSGHREDMYYGLGVAHAYDRPVEMELVRLVAKGRTAEIFGAGPDNALLNYDTIMRRYGLWNSAREQAKLAGPEMVREIEAYCAGVNHVFENHDLPGEFLFLEHRPDPWTTADCLLLMDLLWLVDMTETQGWMEKLIVQMIQKDIPFAKIKELFRYMTDEPTPEYLDILRQVRLADPLVPLTLEWRAMPRLQASNNWAVSGKRTASGQAIMCGDPHLDTARLPSIWYEAAMSDDQGYFMGGTMPGLPGVLVGRSNHLAWSVTYGYMDVTDYYVEEVKDGRYRRGETWLDFRIREEVIGVKGADAVTIKFYENDHGVLEEEPKDDGYYLCFAWSGQNCGAHTLAHFSQAKDCTKAREAMEHFGQMRGGAFNYVMADSSGDIAYHMSGRAPIRAEGASGLLAMPGWDAKYDWQGFYDYTTHARQYNPEQGFIATANNDVNHLSGRVLQNLPMNNHRADRISELLARKSDHTVADMKAMHYDLFSKQAEQFMPLIRPLLPDTPNGKILKDWDLNYNAESLGATLFESVYYELVKYVFGDLGMGREVMEHLIGETILFHDFYEHFDRVLLKDQALWFDGRTRDEVYGTALERGLGIEPRPYGRTRTVLMKNLVYGDIQPEFNYGPIELPGCRATIPQGQIFKTTGGRVATFSPTYRFITELEKDALHSNHAGGPSEKPDSKWYSSGVEGWLKGVYSWLEPGAKKE
jgi:penicillin amidase